MLKKLLVWLAGGMLFAAAIQAQDLALKGGTVLTIANGIIENGTVLIQNGKITAVGGEVRIPAGIQVIDVTGKFVMPGIIDNHTHIALTDINEATDPVTPQIWMKEALDPEIIRSLPPWAVA